MLKPNATTRRPQGHYVYAYIDPRDHTIFYIGHGAYNRYQVHTASTRLRRGTPFYIQLRKLLASDLLPEVIIIKDGLPKEQAYQSEQDLIYLVGTSCTGTGTLSNIVCDYHTPPGMTMAQGVAQGTTIECWGKTFACLKYLAADPHCPWSHSTLKKRMARGFSLEEAVKPRRLPRTP